MKFKVYPKYCGCKKTCRLLNFQPLNNCVFSHRFRMSESEEDNVFGSLSNEDLLHKFNEYKENNRLRLVNIKRMVKQFNSNVVPSMKVFSNFDQKLFDHLKEQCQEVD